VAPRITPRRAALGVLALPVWFIGISAWSFHAAGTLRIEYLGGDARLYTEAAARWLAGADAWQLGASGPYHFAALPTTLFVFAPFTLLPPGAAALIWFALSVMAAHFIVRRLGLPLWWMAFPPFVSGIWAANPDIVMLALLLGPARAVAPLVKVYAAIPLLGERRWRSLVASGALGLVTVALAPGLWLEYLRNATAIAGRLYAEAGGGLSAWGHPLLLVAAVLGLVVLARRDVRAAGWMTVPAIWPAAGFHYNTLVLPARPPTWFAALLAVPMPGLAPLAIVAYALLGNRHS